MSPLKRTGSKFLAVTNGYGPSQSSVAVENRSATVFIGQLTDQKTTRKIHQLVKTADRTLMPLPSATRTATLALRDQPGKILEDQVSIHIQAMSSDFYFPFFS